MKNDYCSLPQQAIQDLKVSDDVKGLLLSPFQWNERNGYIMVPLDTFKDMTDAITAYALELDAKARAAESAPGIVTNRKELRK